MEKLLEPGRSLLYQAVDKHATMGHLHNDLQVDAGEVHLQYWRMLDLEDATGPEDVAIIGDEAEVVRQLHAFADAGATDFLASLFPVGDDGEATKRRTWEG